MFGMNYGRYQKEYHVAALQGRSRMYCKPWGDDDGLSLVGNDIFFGKSFI